LIDFFLFFSCYKEMKKLLLFALLVVCVCGRSFSPFGHKQLKINPKNFQHNIQRDKSASLTYKPADLGCSFKITSETTVSTPNGESFSCNGVLAESAPGIGMFKEYCDTYVPTLSIVRGDLAYTDRSDPRNPQVLIPTASNSESPDLSILFEEKDMLEAMGLYMNGELFYIYMEGFEYTSKSTDRIDSVTYTTYSITDYGVTTVYYVDNGGYIRWIKDIEMNDAGKTLSETLTKLTYSSLNMNDFALDFATFTGLDDKFYTAPTVSPCKCFNHPGMPCSFHVKGTSSEGSNPPVSFDVGAVIDDTPLAYITLGDYHAIYRGDIKTDSGLMSVFIGSDNKCSNNSFSNFPPDDIAPYFPGLQHHFYYDTEETVSCPEDEQCKKFCYGYFADGYLHAANCITVTSSQPHYTVSFSSNFSGKDTNIRISLPLKLCGLSDFVLDQSSYPDCVNSAAYVEPAYTCSEPIDDCPSSGSEEPISFLSASSSYNPLPPYSPSPVVPTSPTSSDDSSSLSGTSSGKVSSASIADVAVTILVATIVIALISLF